MRPGREREPFEGSACRKAICAPSSIACPSMPRRTRRFEAPGVPDELPTPQCDALRLGRQDPHSGGKRTGSAPQRLSRCSPPKGRRIPRSGHRNLCGSQGSWTSFGRGGARPLAAAPVRTRRAVCGPVQPDLEARGVSDEVWAWTPSSAPFSPPVPTLPSWSCATGSGA
jgi:hypothetical protein